GRILLATRLLPSAFVHVFARLRDVKLRARLHALVLRVVAGAWPTLGASRTAVEQVASDSGSPGNLDVTVGAAWQRTRMRRGLLPVGSSARALLCVLLSKIVAVHRSCCWNHHRLLTRLLQ